MEKMKVTQDFLYNIIVERGVNVSTLADFMGMSPTMVSGCFKHQKDAAGRPRNFPAKTLARLNSALVDMAAQMQTAKITFGSDQVYTNNRGATYDPATVVSVNGLHRYFKLTQFLKRALGWSPNKKSIVLHSPSSKGYGCISQDDVDRINAAITEVAILFSSIEVENIDGSSSSLSDEEVEQMYEEEMMLTEVE